ILTSLSQPAFADIVTRTGIAPVGDEPWIKGFTGGSDDHSGAFIAKGFTEVPAASTPAEFLQHVGSRRSRAGGLDGTPLSFAHSLYSIGYQYYRDRFLSKSGRGPDPILRAMSDVLSGSTRPATLRDRVSQIGRRLSGRSDRADEVQFRKMLASE